MHRDRGLYTVSGHMVNRKQQPLTTLNIELRVETKNIHHRSLPDQNAFESSDAIISTARGVCVSLLKVSGCADSRGGTGRPRLIRVLDEVDVEHWSCSLGRCICWVRGLFYNSGTCLI